MSPPEVSVVVATRDRARRLRMLLDSLRAQSLARERFEVIVVDDGSTDETPDLLEAALRKGDLSLRTFRLAVSGGPGAARNVGWRAARAPVVAFTDDDCTASPGWLEAGLRACTRHPGAIVQGRVATNPAEADRLDSFAHSLEVNGVGQGFPTCNILYPRQLLERLGGFDESFGLPAGEDTDLGWRAVEAGAEPVFTEDALVLHGVLPVGALARLRSTMRWTDVIRNYPRHPGLRDELLFRVFWRINHLLLFRFLLALMLPRRFGLLRLALAAPYVAHLTNRRTGPLLAPYLLALDVAEVFAVLRGAVRYRTLVI